MRRRQFLMLVSLLAVGSLAAGLVLASQRGSTEPSATSSSAIHPMVLRGNGVGAAVFGQPEAAAIRNLRAVLGPPNSSHPVDLSGNCTIDSGMEWRTMVAYFLHGTFVGYATGSLLGGLGHNDIPNAVTANGLRIGDPLTRATRLYGGALETSYAQGGSWFVTTPTGKLAGYLTSEVDATKPAPKIADITAGSVGCPAASP